MPFVAPQTLTTDEQKLILRVTAKHPRDHLIISMALGTGLISNHRPSSQKRIIVLSSLFCASKNIIVWSATSSTQ